MKTYIARLNYLYTCIECEIEAKSKREALSIFLEEIEENEGKSFADRAMEFGTFSIVVKE